MAHAQLVCIVDDKADYRFLIQQVFSHQLPAYSIRLFSGGESLLEALSTLDQLPSLILLDRHMPELDGYQTLLRLKEHPNYRKIPVVMMSADASNADIDRCYAAGLNSFVLKQTNFTAFRESIAVICQYWLDVNQEPVWE